MSEVKLVITFRGNQVVSININPLTRICHEN